MCGISGEIRFDEKKPSIETIRNITSALKLRGPDATGLFQRGNVAFGHTRLKIIDLSNAAAQPMVDKELGLVMVFNGCIYNYQEIRAELSKKGYNFFSNGDTEVILKAYHAWGPACVERLRGMFAFAIWNETTEEVFMARDRFGIKPLYYQQTNDCLRFASTLPALLKSEDIDTSINPIALQQYMTFHGIVPYPHTLINGVKKLPQAHWMIVRSDGRTECKRYWDITCTPEKADNIEEWKDRLLEKFTSAVKRRLVADVPVGVLLSGGVDSSLIVGLTASLGCKNIKTFSIGFEDTDNEAGNEFFYSDLIAKHFATDHTEIFIPHSDLAEHLPDCIANMSEPMVSWDNIGFYLLSREVSKHIKVVQCGQGADELFAGYHWHATLLDNSNPRDEFKRLWCDRTWEEYRRMVNPEFVTKDYASEYIDDYYAHSKASSEFEKGIEFDMARLITDDPVKRVDSNTMAWGLEARTPFLDHELAEFAATIPTEYKIRDGSGKWLLKEASRKLLPAEVIDRPKGYFPVPGLKDLSGKVLDFAIETVLSEKSRMRDIFREDYVNELVTHPEQNLTPSGISKLYQMAVLDHWMNVNVASNENVEETPMPMLMKA